MEIMVTMSLLAILLSSLAALTFAVGRRAASVSGGSYKNAVVNEALSRLTVLHYDSLPADTGCVTVAASASPFPHTRCVGIADASIKRRRVTLVVTPASALYRPDTIVFDRTKPATSDPFNTP